jgi:hypothetical protein
MGAPSSATRASVAALAPLPRQGHERVRQSVEFAASTGFAQHIFSAILSNRVGRLLRFERHEIKPKVAIPHSTEREIQE